MPTVEAPARAAAWARAPDVLGVVLALLIAAPTWAQGYVLSFDAVATPRQWLVPDALGLAGVPPRAVPADAVVALATVVLDGAVVQKLLLVGALVAAGLGACRLLRPASVLAQCTAVVAYVWNPWVAERLVLGHWWLLWGYALLPWVVRQSWRLVEPRAGWPEWARLAVVLAAGSLVPSAGVLLAVTATAVLLVELARRPVRKWPVAGAVAWAWAAQLPWLAPSLATRSEWLSTPGLPAVEAFALRAEHLGGALLAAVGLGGAWNAEAIPDSRSLVTASAGAVLALAAAVYGWRPARKALGARISTIAALGASGVTVALLSAWGPGRTVLAALVEAVPGAGLLRDAHKWLAWWALLLAVLAGFAAERLRAWCAPRGAAAAAVLLALLAPVVVLPDLAWGVSGRLQPVDYPADYGTVTRLVSDGPSGDVVSLPWAAFRAYEWNAGRTCLDPLPRWLDRPTVVDDRLVVDGVTLTGESSRAALVTRALESGRPAAEVLPPLGMRWVVVARDTRGPQIPSGFFAGARRVHAGASLELYDLGEPAPGPGWPASTPVVVAIDLAVLAAWVGLGVALALRAAFGLLPSAQARQRGGRTSGKT